MSLDAKNNLTKNEKYDTLLALLKTKVIAGGKNGRN